MVVSVKKTSYLASILVFVVLIIIPQTVSAFTESLSDPLWTLFVAIGGAFTWVGGLLLDFAINKLVIGMGEFFTTNVGLAVDQLWVIIRDLFNILFIFSLIFIGLKTILDSEDSGTRKALGKLIIAALLINFSLLITKTVVDFANIAAFQIHNAVEINADYKVIGFGTLTGKSIAGAYMDQMRLSTFAQDGLADKIAEAGGATKVIIFGFLMMILMIVAGVIFAAGAFILVKRFIQLVFFMIFSPAMFLGFIYPGFQKYQSMWWNQFLRAAFIAPAFMFMIYLSLRVLSGLNPTGSFTKAFTANASASGQFDIFLYFFMAAGFLVGSLVVAQEMGDKTAGATLKFLKTTGNGMRKSAQSFTGRNSIGRISKGLENLNNRMERSRTGRNLKRITSVASLGTFTERDRQKTFRAGATAKFGGNYSRQDDIDFDKGVDKNRRTLNAEKNKEDRAAKSASDRTGILRDLDRSKNLAETEKQISALADNLKALGSSGKAELSLDILKREEVAVNLNDDDIKAIEESGRFRPDDIGDIKKARTEGFENIASQGITKKPGGGAYGGADSVGNSQRRKLMGGATRDVGKLPTAVYLEKDMVPFLTPAAVAERMRNGGFKDNEIDDLRENIEAYANNPLTPASKRKVWRKWSEGSNQFAAELGLTISP